MKKRSLLIGSSIVSLALILTACGGSSSKSSSGGGSGSGGGSVPGVTATSIEFGMVTPLTGAESALGLDGRAGATALIDMINDQGGINGRKLTLSVQDDQYDPQHAVAAAKYFQSQHPVFAIWGNIGTATTLAALPVYQAADLPVLFPEAFTDKLDDYTGAFQVQASFGQSYKTLSDALSTTLPSTTKMGFLYQNDGTSSESLSGFKSGKLAVADAESFEKTANTYATQLGKLKAAGVTDLQFIGNPPQLAIALKEAAAINFKPQWYGSTGVTSPDTFKLAGDMAQGVQTIAFTQSPDADGTGASAFRAAMAKYQPSATVSGYALNDWVGGLLIVDALKRAGKNLTRDSFLKALEATKALDTGGLIPPVTMSATNRVANRCVLILVAQGTKFVQKGNFLCPAS